MEIFKKIVFVTKMGFGYFRRGDSNKFLKNYWCLSLDFYVPNFEKVGGAY